MPVTLFAFLLDVPGWQAACAESVHFAVSFVVAFAPAIGSRARLSNGFKRRSGDRATAKGSGKEWTEAARLPGLDCAVALGASASSAASRVIQRSNSNVPGRSQSFRHATGKNGTSTGNDPGRIVSVAGVKPTTSPSIASGACGSESTSNRAPLK